MSRATNQPKDSFSLKLQKREAPVQSFLLRRRVGGLRGTYFAACLSLALPVWLLQLHLCHADSRLTYMRVPTRMWESQNGRAGSKERKKKICFASLTNVTRLQLCMISSNRNFSSHEQQFHTRARRWLLIKLIIYKFLLSEACINIVLASSVGEKRGAFLFMRPTDQDNGSRNRFDMALGIWCHPKKKKEESHAAAPEIEKKYIKGFFQFLPYVLGGPIFFSSSSCHRG